MILKKELVFQSMVAIAIRKKSTFSLIIATVAMSKKCFKFTTETIGLVGSVKSDIKHHNLKYIYFQKKGAKDKSITILLFMSTFHNFAHKLKTG